MVVPIYNERDTLDELIARVAALPYLEHLVLVDDGSTDGSGELLETWEGRLGSKVTLCRHSSNLGKGRAIRTGLEMCRGMGTAQ